MTKYTPYTRKTNLYTPKTRLYPPRRTRWRNRSLNLATKIGIGILHCWISPSCQKDEATSQNTMMNGGSRLLSMKAKSRSYLQPTGHPLWTPSLWRSRFSGVKTTSTLFIGIEPEHSIRARRIHFRDGIASEMTELRTLFVSTRSS